MNTQTVIQVKQEELDRFLERTSREMILSRYSSREVTSQAAAEVLGVTVQTVNSYVRTGKLRTLNPGSSKYMFRLSDVLQLK